MNDIIKTCKIHGELKQNEIKSGIYKNKKYRKCLYCERERSRKYYSKKYEDNGFVEEKRGKDRKYWSENKAKITQRRRSNGALEKRREWYQDNILRERNRVTIKNKEYRNNLDDVYVKKIIRNGDPIIRSSHIPNSMVELKRAIMLVKRKIKLVRSKKGEDR